jgi:hypothetical protein
MNVLKLWNEVWFGYMSVGDGSEAESDVTGLPDGTKLTTPMQGFPKQNKLGFLISEYSMYFP